MTKPRERSSAEATREVLIGALVRLLKKRTIQAISVRDVATEAGVNHGLVHRLFGSKDGLVKAAARRVSDDIHRGGDGGLGGGGMSTWSFAYLRKHPEIARLVARSCLDGPSELLAAGAPSPERLAEIVAPIQAALDAHGAGFVDAHLLNGLATCALLGWFAFKPLMKKGFGLPPDADDQLAMLLSLLDNLVGAAQERLRFMPSTSS